MEAIGSVVNVGVTVGVDGTVSEIEGAVGL
jgi:hypothetical protein